MTFDPSTLPPLRDVIARHGLAARKGLGQHFLLDGNVTARIARAAGDLTGIGVVEVGPGPGGLTRALLATGAREVVAVERDARCMAALAELAEQAEGRLRLVEGDALEIDATTLTAAPRAIVSNLPYNVGTPLLLGWLRQMAEAPAEAPAWDSLTLMFQKEVADRLVARPGTKTYGRLSVIAQWVAEVEPLFTLPARAFTPPPKIDSTVVRLRPRAHREAVPFAAMERVTAAAFGQRRKMLRQALKPLGDAEALCHAAGLEPTARAETVEIGGFVALAQAAATEKL